MFSPDHATIAVPEASNTTCGLSALLSLDDRSTGSPNVPAAGRNDTCVLSFLSISERVHVASASPAASKATCGANEPMLALALPRLEIETGPPKTRPAGRNAV